MLEEKKQRRTKFRDRLGKRFLQKGNLLKQKKSEPAKKLGERLRSIGFNMLSPESRKEWYKACGSIKGGKVLVERFSPGKFKENNIVLEGFLDPMTGRIGVVENQSLHDVEMHLNYPMPESRKEVLERLRDYSRKMTSNKNLSKKFFEEAEKNLEKKEGSQIFYFSKRKKLSDYLAKTGDRAATHEIEHLKERIRKGYKPLSMKNIPSFLWEELAVEYRTSLKHDGIQDTELPEEHKEWFKELLESSYDYYSLIAAKKTRHFQKTKKLPVSYGKKIVEKDKMKEQIDKRIKLLEKMHNQGMPYEKIREAILKKKAA